MPIRSIRSNETTTVNITPRGVARAAKFAVEADWRRQLPGTVFAVEEWDGTWDFLTVEEAGASTVTVRYKDGTRQRFPRHHLGEIARAVWPSAVSFARGAAFGTVEGAHRTLDDFEVVDGEPRQYVYQEHMYW